MFSPFWYLAVVICGLTNVSEQRKPLTITPSKAAIKPNGSINLKCSSENTLEQCFFRLRGHFNDQTVEWPSFNSTSGEVAMTNSSLNGTVEKTIIVEYKNLTAGSCSINLTQVPEGKYLVGCQGLEENGAWVEKYMALYADERSNFSSNNTEIEMIIPVEFKNESGQVNVNIELKLEHNNYFNGSCKLDGEESKKWRTNITPSSTDTTCTLPIVGNRRTLGPLWATAPFYKGNFTSTWNFMKIIIAKEQTSVTLALNHLVAETVTYIDGDQMNATCSVHGSTQSVNISWNTDEWMEVNTKDNTEEWTWPWETKTIEQTISKKLNLSDNGTILRCTVRYNDTESFEKNVTLVQEEKTSTKPKTLHTTSTETTTEVSTISFTTVTNMVSERPLLESPEFSTALLLSLCLILASVIVGGTIYARRARKCCFKPRANNIDEMEMVQRSQKGSNIAEARELKGKPRAKTPERPLSNAADTTKMPNTYKGEEAVVYAVIAGPPAAAGHQTKITVTEETQYAELSFE